MRRLIYAGIGARDTPVAVARDMERIAMMLAIQGHTLRSGRAPRKTPPTPDTDSADLAFERGCDAVNGLKVIRTPSLGGGPKGAEPWALHAAQYHPAWNSCSEYAKHCHARNSAIILGDHLDAPVDFVVCWTPGAAIVGGTGQALRIANALGVPVFNLATPGAESLLWSLVAAR